MRQLDGGHIVAVPHTDQQLQTTWRAGPRGGGGNRGSSSSLAGPVEDAGVASSRDGREMKRLKNADEAGAALADAVEDGEMGGMGEGGEGAGGGADARAPIKLSRAQRKHKERGARKAAAGNGLTL